MVNKAIVFKKKKKNYYELHKKALPPKKNNQKAHLKKTTTIFKECLHLLSTDLLTKLSKNEGLIYPSNLDTSMPFSQ